MGGHFAEVLFFHPLYFTIYLSLLVRFFVLSLFPTTQSALFIRAGWHGNIIFRLLPYNRVLCASVGWYFIMVFVSVCVDLMIVEGVYTIACIRLASCVFLCLFLKSSGMLFFRRFFSLCWRNVMYWRELV